MRGQRSPAVSNHLDSWTVEDLQHAADAVKDLQSHPGWQVLYGLMDAMWESAVERMIALSAHTEAPMYARVLGMLEGMRVTADALVTIPQKAQEAEQWLMQQIAAQEGEANG